MFSSNDQLGGSSSIRFALYETGEPLRRRLDGKVDRIGLSGTNLTFNDPAGRPHGPPHALPPPITVRRSLFCWIGSKRSTVFASVKAVGHRVVHGMKHTEPERVTPELLDELPASRRMTRIICRARSN